MDVTPSLVPLFPYSFSVFLTPIWIRTYEFSKPHSLFSNTHYVAIVFFLCLFTIFPSHCAFASTLAHFLQLGSLL
ncbi:hypothetical protein RJT34_02115 [Clitoria ternatea]|uniref:Uncharacterized protein n=1 Tax=Clitoria ternatea TaxID=43366 RepID=A0AAN9KK45_CLITE